MFKVALVGIGGMGNVHFNAYRRMKNAEVIAVADVRVDMAKEKTKGTNAKIYATLEELLKNVEVIEETDTKKNSGIGFGSVVTVIAEDDKEYEYMIVGAAEANFLENKISNESP